jgi:hypothetical protein
LVVFRAMCGEMLKSRGSPTVLVQIVGLVSAERNAAIPSNRGSSMLEACAFDEPVRTRS